jgi:hypothetical protein
MEPLKIYCIFKELTFWVNFCFGSRYPFKARHRCVIRSEMSKLWTTDQELKPEISPE